jgi:UDP-glucose 4-epimerase
VYHLAAMVGVQRVLADPVAGMRVNMIGTDNVMRAASRYRPRVAFASSSEIYGTGTEGRLSEEGQRVYGATRTYRWAYAGAKALAESLLFACASQARFPAVVLRPFNVVGPGQQPESGMVLPRFVAAALAGTPITVFGNGTQTRSFVHVDDVVAAMVAAVREPRAHGLAMNVGNDRPISIVGLAHLVRTVAASRSPIEFVPYERAYPPGFEEIMQRVPDLRVITRAIGFRPTHSIGSIVYQLVAAAREVISQ